MTLRLLGVAAYASIPVAAAILGGVIAAARPPGVRLRSGVQHFAAGVVFAAAALELLPRVVRQSPPVAIIGFAAGIGVMLLLRRLSHRRRRRSEGYEGLPTGLIVATGFDVFVDGVVTGAGFAAGRRTGILLVVAFVLEFFFLGLSVSSSVTGHARRPRAVVVTAGIAAAALPGALSGAALLTGAGPTALGIVLAFGAVALMYLVTEELLVEAHEAVDPPWAAALFFVGFLIYLVIQELA